ncbi:MAG TPA: cyclic nucleotide-binding domain-containing protein [Kofleriaceae bacterium]|nr:cyclic nucleotide-binding domain-containing protein [Kofleriaceae bacterium]
MLGAHTEELIWVMGLLVAVVITAALINRFRPVHRPRLRRLTTVFALFAIATGAVIGFEAAGLPAWASGLSLASEILWAFTIVSVAATLAFAVMLPAIAIDLPMIASDLLVGVGYVVVTLAILSRHGVNPTSAMVSGAVVSAVLAISLQSTLGNIVGGVALQLDGSIREGDWIQLENGKQGKVRSVRWRHTVLETRDYSTIIVPNAQLLANSITILGKREGRNVPQRMKVWFNVDFRFAPSRVIRVVTEALQGAVIDNVAAEPKLNVVCSDLSQDGREGIASYMVRYWIQDLTTDESTNSRVRARIYAALQRAQIPLAISPRQHHDPALDEWPLRLTDRSLGERLVALKTVHLFRTLTDDELRTLAAGMNQAIYVAGEVITRQGAAGNWLYVMTRGAAEILANKAKIAQLSAPDFFGEMSLMTGEPRTADVVATDDVDCFRLGKDTFEAVLLARPEIAEELSHKLAARRVELVAAREGLDHAARSDRLASERARILGGIKAFFALN